MRKMILTPCFVSKGYNSDDHFRFSQDGSMVQFRVGMKVYDKREPENTRWININVKAFGPQCERVKSMQLKPGSVLSLDGRFDIDSWEDSQTGEKKSAPVIIIDDIEYAGSNGGGKKQNGNGDNTPADEPPTASSNSSGTPAPQQQDNSATGSQQQMPENFTGFEGFGGPNPFFPQG